MPPAGFARVPVTLEDAYLVLMRLGALPGAALPRPALADGRGPRTGGGTMSIARLSASFRVEFRYSFRRPLFIALAVILALTAFGLSSGHMQISSGDSSVGGTKAWITSEFAADPDHDLPHAPLLRVLRGRGCRPVVAARPGDPGGRAAALDPDDARANTYGGVSWRWWGAS